MSFDYSMMSIEKMSSSLFESYMSIRPMFDLKPNMQHGVPPSGAASETGGGAAMPSPSAQLPKQSLASQRLYSHVFGFESLFQTTSNVESVRLWMVDHWTISIPIALVYCVLVYAGRSWMEKKARYECRLPLIIWNCMLASFSILGTVRVLPEFLYTISSKDGLYKSVCDNSYAYGITGFWAFMFVLSKLPELIDTLFIVLRKQQLIFLHWYHHATVLIYCWHSYQELASTGRWFMTMNYFVHSLMYSYYACRAMRINLPSFVNKLITTLQILQMVAGIFVNYQAYKSKSSSLACNLSYENMFYSSVMYISYFVLFFNFFVQTYILRNKKPSSSSAAVQSNKKETSSPAIDSNNNSSAKYDKNARKKHN